jgi:hypothetical protein
MTASVDVLQILNDDTNLTPFYNAAAADVLGAQVLDAQGNASQRGLADASIEVLSRVFAAARNAQGTETCSMEIDPNGAIGAMLGHMVTPAGTSQATPIETLMDVTADVNRAHPELTTKLDGGDYGNMANEISEFCLDPTTGMEQVYAVVRAATLPDASN